MSDPRSLLERESRRFIQPDGAFERLVRRRDRRRRNQRITAGVVGIAVFVAAVWFVTGDWSLGRTQTPAAPGGSGTEPTITGSDPADAQRVGFIGLPPEGAVPSRQGAELVLSYFGRSTTDGGPLIAVFVYEDGQLIWRKEGDLPYGANRSSTGFLEQRLTPEGVALMRDEIVSTGLFDRDRSLLVQGTEPGVIWGGVEVLAGGRDVSVAWDRANPGYEVHGKIATPEQTGAIHRLDGLLTHPESWLPADAWADPTIRPYVPSRFQVCAGPWQEAAVGPAEDPSDVLSLLPTRAAGLLQDGYRTRETFSISNDRYFCSDLTTKDSRLFVEAMADASILPNTSRDDWLLEYRLADAELGGVIVTFEPYLPHGEVTCSACG